VLPDWTHNTAGAFFTAVMSGNDERLREVAAKIVSPEFSRAIVVQPDPANQAVLLRFPPPASAPECYFVYIANAKKKGEFRYFTYERTVDVTGSGARGVIGGWNKDHDHQNFGERAYEDSESFVRDVRQLSAL